MLLPFFDDCSGEMGEEGAGQFADVGALCHAAEAAHIYSGGHNMTLASNVDIEFEFAAACRYKIFAVQLQRVKIDSAGTIMAFLE